MYKPRSQSVPIASEHFNIKHAPRPSQICQNTCFYIYTFSQMVGASEHIFFTQNARSQTVPYASEHVFLHCSVRERQPTRQAGSRTPSSSNLPMLLKLPSRKISLHIDQRLLQGRILPSPSNACQPIEIINFQILPGLRKLLSHN